MEFNTRAMPDETHGSIPRMPESIPVGIWHRQLPDVLPSRVSGMTCVYVDPWPRVSTVSNDPWKTLRVLFTENTREACERPDGLFSVSNTRETRELLHGYLPHTHRLGTPCIPATFLVAFHNY